MKKKKKNKKKKLQLRYMVKLKILLNFSSSLLFFQTAFLTVALLPFRLAAITALVIMAWLLACLGLHGLTEDDLRRAPLTGWRR